MRTVILLLLLLAVPLVGARGDEVTSAELASAYSLCLERFWGPQCPPMRAGIWEGCTVPAIVPHWYLEECAIVAAEIDKRADAIKPPPRISDDDARVIIRRAVHGIYP